MYDRLGRREKGETNSQEGNQKGSSNLRYLRLGNFSSRGATYVIVHHGNQFKKAWIIFFVKSLQDDLFLSISIGFL